MSINSAMLAGVSGLTANSAALAAISDNIANVNTVGYKRSQSQFQTIVTSQAAAGAYSAGGVQASTRAYVSQQGLLQRTSSNTDLGIAGAGFFVTTQKPEGLDSTDARLFTRAGSFQVDDLGYLRNSAGLYLQGWTADSDGAITIDPSDITRLSSINVGTVGGAAEQTTRVGLNANLKSSQPLSSELGTYNVATNSMAMYDPETGAGVKPGITHGATDEFGHHAVEDVVNHYDYHATLLHLFGLDPKSLVYKRNGTDQALITDERARVVSELLA